MYKNNYFEKCVCTMLFFLTTVMLFAQRGDATNAFNEIQTSLSSYVQPISNICLIVAAIIGTIGGVRVYIKWNNGDPDTQKAVVGWVSGCIFMILVSVIIRLMFGVNA